MAVRDAFKVTRKTFFNPRAWFSYDEFLNHNRIIWGSIKSVVVAPAVEPGAEEETFEQAMERNGMSEEDRQIGIKAYRNFALIFVSLAVFSFIYAFFLLFAYHVLSGWLLAMSVCALLLSQAFKYDFWALQLQRRKLNLTFDDWKNNILGNKGGAA